MILCCSSLQGSKKKSKKRISATGGVWTASMRVSSLIIQTLHIAPWENGRERRVWYLTPLIASQANCLIFVVGSDWLLEQLITYANLFYNTFGKIMASQRASITKELLRESRESVLKPFKIHSLDDGKFACVLEFLMDRKVFVNRQTGSGTQLVVSNIRLFSRVHSPRAWCEESALSG